MTTTPSPCAHPADAREPLLRLGVATGNLRCRACGAVLGPDGQPARAATGL